MKFLHSLVLLFLMLIPLLGGASLIHAENAATEIFSFDQVDNPTNVEVLGAGAPGDVRGFMLALADIARTAVSIIAVLAIVYVGIRIITSIDNDEEIGKQRKVLFGIIGGLIIMNIGGTYVNILYQPRIGVDSGSVGNTALISAQKFQRDLVEPMINFGMTFIAAIAVFMIVVAGFRMITSGGDEQQQEKQRFVVVQAVVGLVVILLAQPIVKAVFGYIEFQIPNVGEAPPRLESDLTFAIGVITQIINYILTFFFLGAFMMLIYAGFLMVSHFGQDDFIDKAKKIIRYTIIAMVVAISAYTLVAWLVTLTP